MLQSTVIRSFFFFYQMCACNDEFGFLKFSLKNNFQSPKLLICRLGHDQIVF